MYAFVDFKVVVGWQQGNGIFDVLIVKNIVGYGVQSTSGTSRLGDYFNVSLFLFSDPGLHLVSCDDGLLTP